MIRLRTNGFPTLRCWTSANSCRGAISNAFIDFFSSRAGEDSGSDSEGEEQTASSVVGGAKLRNYDQIAKERAALESILTAEREKVKLMLKERNELSEKLTSTMMELTTLRRELEKRDRLVDDLQFELRRVIARQQKSDTEYFRDDAKVKVAERVREFEAHLAAIRVMQERRVALGTRSKTSGGADDDELEAMRKQLLATRELLNEFQSRFGADDNELKRQLDNKNATIDALTRELTETQEDLARQKQEAEDQRKHYLALIHRLHRTFKRHIAAIRDTAYLNPKTHLPKFFDELPLSAQQGGEAAINADGLLAATTTRLIQKGVLLKLTVTPQGRTLRPRYYFALFVDDNDGVTLRWGSQEAPYEGYSHSVPITGVISGGSASSQLKSGAIGGEHGQTIASLLFPEEESRLMIVSIAGSAKKLFLIASSANVCATWQAYFNQALDMKSHNAETASCPLGELAGAVASVEQPSAIPTPAKTINSELQLTSPPVADTPSQDIATGAKKNETVTLPSLPERPSRASVATNASRRSAYSVEDHALATAAAQQLLEESRATFADDPAEAHADASSAFSQATPTDSTTGKSSEQTDATPAAPHEADIASTEPVIEQPQPINNAIDMVPESLPSSESPIEQSNQDSSEAAENSERLASAVAESDRPSNSFDEAAPILPADTTAVVANLIEPGSPAAEEVKSSVVGDNGSQPDASVTAAAATVASTEEATPAAYVPEFPVCGPLVKFTHNGKDKHTKYFCLEGSGKISWGDGPSKYRYNESVRNVFRGAGKNFETKMKPEELVYLFTIETTGKDLNLLAPNQESMEMWIAAATYALSASKSK